MKILMRGGVSPYKNILAEEMLSRDFQGTNTGNLVYQYSLYRILKTENVEIVMDNYAIKPENASIINEKYDAYVIPLADAFRSNFRKKLRDYATLINDLEIPVIVVGVGIRASSMEELLSEHDFDEDVKLFVDAVLKKSNMIGLRGALTGIYLEKLGYKSGVDFTPIGCPSMYMFGQDLKLKDVKVSEDMKLAINASTVTNGNVCKKIYDVACAIEDYTFIPQFYSEFKMTYFGYGEVPGEDQYPVNCDHKYYKDGKVKFFLTAQGWFDFIKTCDLSFGSRLHGNIVALVNGTPAITVVKDLRMKELIDLHKIPNIMQDDIEKYENLEEMASALNFKEVEEAHNANFENFKNFLDTNNLDSIFNYPDTECEFDAKIKEINFLEGIVPINSLEKEEILKRLRHFDITEKRSIRLAKARNLLKPNE